MMFENSRAHEGAERTAYNSEVDVVPHSVPKRTLVSSHGILARWPVPRPDEVLIVPVGGIGRIGMNWTLYGNSGRWLLVDAGIAFPEDGMEGVDALVPDPSALEQIIPRLDGLVVTHAHEDHIGAIHRLWPNALNCPIFASPFASAAIARRLEESGGYDDVAIHTFEVGSRFLVGPFDIQTIRMTHSVPEPVALAITTFAGTVVHTGDWKSDPNPLVGQPMDIPALREVGDRGVLAMLCDSTNSNKETFITSEWQVRQAYRHLFSQCRGIVVAAFFSTNVARIASACMAAGESGRKIAIAGRSMRTNYDIAQSLGMLPEIADAPWVLAETMHLRGLDRSETALICTGTQGEERAALAKLSRGDYRLPKLGPGDVVVLSSRIIPGNEMDVEKVLSGLRQRGVQTLTGNDFFAGYPLHVTGHPGRTEVQMMHNTVRPRFAIPVHGEEAHLRAQAEIAMSCGAEAAPILSEGSVITVSERGARILGNVNVPIIGVCDEDAIYDRSRQAQPLTM